MEALQDKLLSGASGDRGHRAEVPHLSSSLLSSPFLPSSCQEAPQDPPRTRSPPGSQSQGSVLELDEHCLLPEGCLLILLENESSPELVITPTCPEVALANLLLSPWATLCTATASRTDRLIPDSHLLLYPELRTYRSTWVPLWSPTPLSPQPTHPQLTCTKMGSGVPGLRDHQYKERMAREALRVSN